MRRDYSYDELDAMCERFAEAEFQCGEWWPTMQQVKERIEPQIKTLLDFVIWITETAVSPKNEEEELVRKRLLQLINANLRIRDE